MVMRACSVGLKETGEVTDSDGAGEWYNCKKMRMKNKNQYLVTPDGPCAEFVGVNTYLRLVGKNICNEKAIAAIK
jgi:hypothetical protein